MFCRQVVVTVPSDPSGRPVTSTSTRRPGKNEPSNTGDIRDANRYGSHTDWNDGSESKSAATYGKATFLHRLINQNAIDYRPIDDLFDLGEGALREIFSETLCEAYVTGLIGDSDIQLLGGDDNFFDVGVLLRRARAARRPGSRIPTR